MAQVFDPLENEQDRQGGSTSLIDDKLRGSELLEEIEAFEMEQADLEANSLGKWVVFHGQERVGVYDDFQEAAQESVRRFGRGPYLIRRVGEKEMALPSSLLFGDR